MEYKNIKLIRNLLKILDSKSKDACLALNIDPIYGDDLIIHSLSEDYSSYQNLIYYVPNINNFDLIMTQFIMGSIHAVLVTDLFRKFNYINKLKQSAASETDEESKISLEFITTVIDDSRKAINDNNTLTLLSNRFAFSFFKDAALKFDDMSALDKLLYTKALSDEDVELLSNFNVYFKAEYDHFNITTDINFINKHLNIWNNQFGEEQAVSHMADFILKLYHVCGRLNDINSFINDLIPESSDVDDIILIIDQNKKEELEQILKVHLKRINGPVRTK